MHHRSDIDGMRAIAVSAVVLFHADVPGFELGYLGVDIFFVLSGYLITTNVLTDVRAGQFNFFEFLLRRARRIVPALYAVLVATAVFAWLYLFPADLERFANSLFAASLFVSNVVYAATADYNATFIAGDALLHTWSLGVEGQFYLLFPIALWILYRGELLAVAGVVCVAALASFWAAWVMMDDNPVATFFLPQYRLWEFSAGALVSIAVMRSAPADVDILAGLGLGLIVATFIWFEPTGENSPLAALLTILGACLVLKFSGPSGYCSRLLSVRPLVGLGLISYSVYLWHQPILVFARVRTIEPSFGAGQLLAILLLIVLLSYLTWLFVETPFRRKTTGGAGQVIQPVVGAGAVILVCWGVFVAASQTQGAPGRFPEDVIRALDAKNDIPLRNLGCLKGKFAFAASRGSPCRIGRQGDGVDFVLIGDSYAQALAPGIALAAEAEGKTGVLVAAASCPPILGARAAWYGSRKECAAFKETMIAETKALAPKLIILHGVWASMNNPGNLGSPGAGRDETIALYTAAMKETIDGFRQTGAEIVVILEFPRADFLVPEYVAKSILFKGLDEHFYPRPDWSNWPMSKVWDDLEVSAGIRFIDPADFVCDETTCSAAFDNYPVYRDRGHVTGTVARLLAPEFRAALWR